MELTLFRKFWLDDDEVDLHKNPGIQNVRHYISKFDKGNLFLQSSRFKELIHSLLGLCDSNAFVA